MRIQSLFLGTAAAALVSGSAFAADLTTRPPLVVPDQWLLTLGVGAGVENQFPGSKTYTAVPKGQITRWRSGEPEPFIALDDGFTVDIFDYGPFKAGPVARYISRRGLSDGNGAFFGLHNVGWSGELGGFVEYLFANVIRTHLEVTQAVNGNKGLEANLSIDGVYRYGPWTFSAGPRLGYGDSPFMSSYFSVNPVEALLNGRVTPYTASAGFDSFGGLLSARYDFNRSWNTIVYGGYNRLIGDAAASPISYRLGSRDEFKGGATINYTFAWGGLGILGF